MMFVNATINPQTNMCVHMYYSRLYKHIIDIVDMMTCCVYRTIVSTSDVNLTDSSPQQRLNTGFSPNPQAVGYGTTNQPVAEYQYLSQSDRVPVVPKVYASLVAVPPQIQSSAVYSPHSDANVVEYEMTNHPATEYEALSSEARVPVVHKVYASLKGPGGGDINT